MDKLFDTVLELSWQAGLIALAVMAVRLVLRKKASRRALCMLWALVALRLLLPVSLTVESPVSLQAEEAPVSRAYHAMQEARTSVPEEAAPAPAESSGTAAAVVPHGVVDVEAERLPAAIAVEQRRIDALGQRRGKEGGILRHRIQHQRTQLARHG